MKIQLAAAALAAIGLAAAAGADEGSAARNAKVRHVPVAYGDLDLARSADAAEMLERIRTAARRACGFSGPSVTDRTEHRACTRDAVAEAVAELDAPLVTALYERRSGSPAYALASASE